VQARRFLPNLSVSPHLGAYRDDDFPNAQRFASHGIFLPSGPDMPPGTVERVCDALRAIAPQLQGSAPPIPAPATA
jgi:dTDP-4-amino-4,6-dideoxygalactose transaminase